MLKTAKLLGAVLYGAIAVFFIMGCTNVASESEQKVTNQVETFTQPKGTLADWAIAPGYQNTVTEDQLSISEDTENVNSENGDAKCMKVIWSASADFKSCELYALLPNNPAVDYGRYDGIQFDVKLPASTNFMLLIRNPAGGTTAKIWEDYVYRGTDDADTYVWVTVKQPFADATDTGWGPAMEGTLKQWLSADKATQKQINLNPVLNIGGGSAIDTDQVTYFDNIGFYKAGTTADKDVFTAVWDFE